MIYLIAVCLVQNSILIHKHFTRKSSSNAPTPTTDVGEGEQNAFSGNESLNVDDDGVDGTCDDDRCWLRPLLLLLLLLPLLLLLLVPLTVSLAGAVIAVVVAAVVVADVVAAISDISNDFDRRRHFLYFLLFPPLNVVGVNSTNELDDSSSSK